MSAGSSHRDKEAEALKPEKISGSGMKRKREADSKSDERQAGAPSTSGIAPVAPAAALETLTNQLDTCTAVISKLLKEKSVMDKKEARLRCFGNTARLGWYTKSVVGTMHANRWTDGPVFNELDSKVKAISAKLEEVIQKKKLLKKQRPTNSKTRRKRGRSVKNDSVVQPDSDVGILAAQEYHLVGEILACTQSGYKKQIAELNRERKILEREKQIHIREYLRIEYENNSKFKDNPVLNGRYLFLSIAWKGGFSEVHKAFDLIEHRYVACKIHQLNIDWKDHKKANYIKHAIRENKIHKALDHPRVVKMYDDFAIDANSFCTVLEYCGDQDLDFYLKQYKMIPEREASLVIKHVVSALKYLSELKKPVIHYDLKPGNILLTTGTIPGQIKITDFGVSKIMDMADHEIDLTSQGLGTLWYLPPECFVYGDKPPKVSSKVDVWSVGVIFYECLYGKKPFGHGMQQHVIVRDKIILNATEVEFPNKPSVSNQAKDFIRSCLTYDKEQRMDVITLANHEYLQPALGRPKRLRGKNGNLGKRLAASSSSTSME